MLAIWFLVPLPFPNLAWTSGSSWFTYCWSLAWRNLSTSMLLVSEVTQSCPTLCGPMDCSLPGSSLHGILHTRILEWVAVSFSRTPSYPCKNKHWVQFVLNSFLYWSSRLLIIICPYLVSHPRYERPRFNPWVGKIPWRRAWKPIPYFCLETPMDRGAWQATVHGAAKSRTWLSDYAQHHVWFYLPLIPVSPLGKNIRG